MKSVTGMLGMTCRFGREVESRPTAHSYYIKETFQVHQTHEPSLVCTLNCRLRFLLREETRGARETDEKEIMNNRKFVVSVVISSPLVYLLLCLYTEPPGPVSVVESWPHGIRFAKWRDHDLPTNRWLDWDRIGHGLGLDRGNLRLF